MSRSKRDISQNTATGDDHLDASADPITIVASAQRLVENLTAEIKRLRDDKKILKLRVDDITSECTQLRETIESQEKAAIMHASVSEAQLMIQTQLSARLEQRCEKLSLLVQLTSLKTQELSAELQATRAQQQQQLEDFREQLARSDQRRDEHAAYLTQYREENVRLQEYVLRLEKEIEAQWQGRQHDAQQRAHLEEERKLLQNELDVLKPLAGIGRSLQ